jgi:hypothetical protein
MSLLRNAGHGGKAGLESWEEGVSRFSVEQTCSNDRCRDNHICVASVSDGSTPGNSIAMPILLLDLEPLSRGRTHGLGICLIESTSRRGGSAGVA